MSFYKYLFRLVRGKILFVLEHAVHNFFAINLKKLSASCVSHIGGLDDVTGM